MKKVTFFSSILWIVCISFVILFATALHLISATKENTTAKKSKEEIIALFDANKESFVSAGEDLSSIPFLWHIGEHLVKGGGHEITHLKNGLDVEINAQWIRHKKSADLKVMAETNPNIIKIIKEFGFQRIASNFYDVAGNNKCVYFIQYYGPGLDTGIIYAPNQQTQNIYIENLIPICPMWYYYESN